MTASRHEGAKGYEPTEEAAGQDTLLEQLKRGGRLPSPAGVALRVLELSTREDGSANEVARALQADPVLTGCVIRAANSAAQGRRAVMSIGDAVVRLGLRAVRQLVLGVSLLEQSRAGDCAAFDYPQYWSRCLASAVAAEHLARFVQVAPAEDCFTLALLQDIGTLGLASAYPRDYALLLQGGAASPAAMRDAERAAFGISRDDVTRSLLEDWRIPAPLIAAVVDRAPRSRDDNSRTRRLAKLMALAMEIGNRCAPARTQIAFEPLLDQLADFNIETTQAELFLTEIQKDHSTWCAELQINPLAVSVEALVAGAKGASARAAPGAAETVLRAVLIDSSGPPSHTAAQLLESLGSSTQLAEDLPQALALHLAAPADVYLVNLASLKFDGLAICRALRAAPAGRGATILGISDDQDEERLEQALSAGVDDVLLKPLRKRELAARLRLIGRIAEQSRALFAKTRELSETTARLTDFNQSLARAANTDVLTGLPNRRSILHRLQREWEHSASQQLPCSLFVIDVDQFKQVNDQYGHEVGDLVLESIAAILRSSIREIDIVGRLGGEEFAVICPGANGAAAFVLAERIRSQFENHVFPIGSDKVRVTVSIGIATAEIAPAHPWSHALRSADLAMYGAKGAGRNRIGAATV